MTVFQKTLLLVTMFKFSVLIHSMEKPGTWQPKNTEIILHSIMNNTDTDLSLEKIDPTAPNISFNEQVKRNFPSGERTIINELFKFKKINNNEYVAGIRLFKDFQPLEWIFKVHIIRNEHSNNYELTASLLNYSKSQNIPVSKSQFAWSPSDKELLKAELDVTIDAKSPQNSNFTINPKKELKSEKNNPKKTTSFIKQLFRK